MSKYNFDKLIDRCNTNSIKYDFKKELNKSDDILPMWIADMDFEGEKKVAKEIKKACKHSIFGYSNVKDEYYDSLIKWYKNNFNFEFNKEEVLMVPGVVFALALAVMAYTKENDAIMINEPVYYPFRKTIENNKRLTINSSLKLINGHYEMDFDDIEEKIVSNNVKMYILCSPHNPCGRVWTKTELEKVIEICKKHNVLLFSDEIHSDFAFETNAHHPLFTVNNDACEIGIVALAPSKTFNIAGLSVSHVIIKNKELRDKYQHMLDCLGGCTPNMLGLVASKACYDYAGDWFKNVKAYIKSNLDYVREEVKNIDGVELIEPEGTYLIWLDMRGLKKDNLYEFIEKDCKLWIDEGILFGKDGDGFIRINIATSRKNVEEAIKRIKENL